MIKIWERVNKEVKEFLQTKNLTSTDEDVVQFLADLPLGDSWTTVPRENYVTKKHVPQFQIIDDYDGKSENVKDVPKDIPALQSMSTSPMNGLFMSLKVYRMFLTILSSPMTLQTKRNSITRAKLCHLRII